MKIKRVSANLIVAILFSLLFMPVREAWATESSLKCTPVTGTYSVGDTFTVDVTLDTRTFTAYGADVEATFDQGILTAVGTQSTPVTSVTNWGQPTTNTIDTSAGKTGKVSLDYGQAQPGFTGSTSIGKVNLKATAEGQAQFNFVFFQQYDNTTPGVAKVWGKKDGVNLSNILTDVGNCIYVIAAANPTTPPQPTSTAIPQVTSLPESGAVENTIAIVGLSGVFLIMGFASIVLDRKKAI